MAIITKLNRAWCIFNHNELMTPKKVVHIVGVKHNISSPSVKLQNTYPGSTQCLILVHLIEFHFQATCFSTLPVRICPVLMAKKIFVHHVLSFGCHYFSFLQFMQYSTIAAFPWIHLNNRKSITVLISNSGYLIGLGTFNN